MNQKVSASLLKNSLYLTLFAFLGKVFGAFFKVGLTNFVGAEGMGVYGLVFPIFVFFQIFSSQGVGVGLTINIAKAKDESVRAGYKLFALKLMAILVFLSGFVIIAFSKIIANIQGCSVSPSLYVVVALGVVSVSALTYLKAIIKGHENFRLFSISELFEDFFKIIFALVFAYLLKGYGASASIIGVFCGIVISSFVSGIIILICGKSYFKKTISRNLQRFEKQEFSRFAIIISLSALVVPALQVLDSILVVRLLCENLLESATATKLFGLSRGTVAALLNLPAFLMVSFEILLLPRLSKAGANDGCNKSTIGLILAVFLSVPFVFVFLIFSKEIITILYGSALTAEEIIIASKLLKLGSISIMFSAITNILMVGLESKNKSFIPFLAAIVAGVLKIIFTIIFVPKISIYGAELSSVLFVLVETIIIVFYSVKLRLFNKPASITLIVLFWSVLVGFVYVLYKGFCEKLSLFWSLALAFIVAIMFVLVLLILVFVYLWKRNKNRLNKN